MAKQKAHPAQRKSGGFGTKMMFLTMVLMAVPFSMPTIVVLFFATLPTAVAAVVERPPGRFAWLSVGGCNFAAVSPYLFDMWFGNHSIGAALDILTNVKALLIFYAAAAAGWLIYVAMPPVTGAVLTLMAQRRAAALRSMQKRLVERWGEAVKSEEPAQVRMR